MPIIPQKAAADMTAFAAASGMSGSQFPRQALAVSTAFATYIMTPGMISGSIVGVSGVGVVTAASPVIAVPQAMAASIMTGMATSGMIGPSLPLIVNAIATGLSLNMATLGVVGSCAGVSTGGGTGKVIGFIPPAFFAMLMTNMAMMGMVGSAVPQFCKGLSDGLCIYMNSAVVLPLLSVGPPIPPPPAGPVPSVGVAVAQFV